MGVIAPKEGQGGSVISSPGSPTPITHSSGQEKNLLLSVSLRGPKGERGEPGFPGGVISVNTKTGDVSLSADDVGADVAGTAAGAVATHEAASDPHPQYERSLSAGTNITIDRTDPANPVISASSGGGGAVNSVNGQTGDVDLSGLYVPLGHEGSGGTAHTNAVAGGAAGFMSGADKTKLDGIAAGAQVNVATNLSQGTRTATSVPVTSSTGTEATLNAATTLLAGVMTAADKAKLDGIVTGATANSSDAALLSRANHTGTQSISTVAGLETALSDKLPASGTAADSNKLGGELPAFYAPVAQVTTVSSSRTLTLTDVGNYLVTSATTAMTLTIPPQADTTWPANTEIHIEQGASGAVTVAGGTGVTLQHGASVVPTTRDAHLPVTLKRKAEDVWVVFGGLEDAP